jgi:hypothetical protein
VNQSITSLIVQIKVESAEALSALKDFAAGTDGAMQVVEKSTAAAAKGPEAITKNAFRARMGLMELEHTARSTMDILLLGGSPRMLLAQIPQMIQGATMLGLGLSTLLPVIAGVGAALGAGYWLWSEWTAGERAAAEEAKNLETAWKGLIPLLKEINEQQKAGLLGPAAAAEYEDYLTGNKNLYVNSAGQTTPQESEQKEEYYHTGDPFKDQQTHLVDSLNRPATQAEIQKYVRDQITANGQVTDAQAAAMARLRELEEQASRETLSDLEKQKAEIRDKYEKQRQEIELTAKAAGAQLGNINFASAPKVKAAQKALADTAAAEAKDVAAAEQKAAEQAAQKKLEAEQKAAAEYQRDWLKANKDLDANLDLQAAESGKKRMDFYAQEFLQRQALAFKFSVMGKLTEEQYADATRQAQIKMLEGQQNYNRELQRTQQMQSELARTETEARLHAVQSNSFLTDNEKAAQSIPLIQKMLQQNAAAQAGWEKTAGSTKDEAARIEALNKVNELTMQQIDLQNQLMEAQGRASFKTQFRGALTDIQNQWGTWAIQAASTFKSVFNSAVSSISNGITGLIMGTKTWGQALRDIGSDILNSIVSGIVRMGIQWVLTQTLMATVGKTSAAATLATTAPIAAAQTAIWSAPATLATIATLGGAALQAPGVIGLAQGLTLLNSLAGFAAGGAVDGPGTGTSDSILARLSKGEFVMPAARVNEFGAPFFEAIRTGALRAQDLASMAAPTQRAVPATGRMSGGGAGATNVKATSHVVLVNDRSEMLDALKSAHAEEVIVAAVRKNRLKIGIRT